MTDQFQSYKKLGKEFQSHEVVNHGAGEYVRGDAYTNTAESFFALLKRGHYGVFHHFGKQHLQRYVDEFSFRWEHRKVPDTARRDAAIAMTEGKRLTYK